MVYCDEWETDGLPRHLVARVPTAPLNSVPVITTDPPAPHPTTASLDPGNQEVSLEIPSNQKIGIE